MSALMRPNDHCVGLRTRRLRRAERTRLGFGEERFAVGELDGVVGGKCFVGVAFGGGVEEESFAVSGIVIASEEQSVVVVVISELVVAVSEVIVSEESFVGFEFVVVVAAVVVAAAEDAVVADDEFFNRFSWKPMAYKRGKAKMI